MPPTFFSQVLIPFTVAAGAWIPLVLSLGTPIFWMVATLELMAAFAAGVMDHDVGAILCNLTNAVIGIGVAYVIFIYSPGWGEDLVSTFGLLGNEFGGGIGGVATPDTIMQAGVQISSVLWAAAGAGGWLTTLEMPMTTLLVMIIAGLVYLVYAWIALKLTMLLIETFVSCILGAMFLPFGAFYFTKRLVGTWIDWMLGVGVQIFMTYAILSIGTTLMAQWATYVAGEASLLTSNWYMAFVILVQALVFWMVLIYVPKQARAYVSGVTSPYGFLQAVSAAAPLGQAAAGVAGAVNDSIDAPLAGGMDAIQSKITSMLFTT